MFEEFNLSADIVSSNEICFFRLARNFSTSNIVDKLNNLVFLLISIHSISGRAAELQTRRMGRVSPARNIFYRDK